jgi:hypothetical protein
MVTNIAGNNYIDAVDLAFGPIGHAAAASRRLCATYSGGFYGFLRSGHSRNSTI